MIHLTICVHCCAWCCHHYGHPKIESVFLHMCTFFPWSYKNRRVTILCYTGYYPVLKGERDYLAHLRKKMCQFSSSMQCQHNCRCSIIVFCCMQVTLAVSLKSIFTQLFVSTGSARYSFVLLIGDCNTCRSQNFSMPFGLSFFRLDKITPYRLLSMWKHFADLQFKISEAHRFDNLIALSI
jgi:hypothetical protein